MTQTFTPQWLIDNEWTVTLSKSGLNSVLAVATRDVAGQQQKVLTDDFSVEKALQRLTDKASLTGEYEGETICYGCGEFEEWCDCEEPTP